jgi:hypothetical protein
MSLRSNYWRAIRLGVGSALALSVTALSIQSAVAQNNSSEIRRYSYGIFTSAELGRGWDSRKDSLTNDTCLEFGVSSQALNSEGGSMRLVSDNYSLAAELELTISSQMKAVAGYLSSSSDKVSMAYSTAISSSQSMFVANRRVFSHKSELSTSGSPNNAIKLRSDYKKLNDAQFKDRCGDGYIVGIIYGGELNLLAKLAERTNSQRSSVSASFERGSEIAGTSFSSAMKASLKRQYASKSLKISYASSGGTSPKLADDPAKFTEQFNEWSVTRETAKPIYFLVRNYGSLRNGLLMSAPPSFTTMQRIAILYWRLDKLRNSIADMTDSDSHVRWALKRNVHSDYIGYDAELLRAMNSLKTAAKNCLDGMKGSRSSCTFPVDVDWKLEYRIRAEMPFPTGADMNTYFQYNRNVLSDKKWQYWLKDTYNNRRNNSEPMNVSLGEITDLLVPVKANTTKRPYPSFHLTGSFSKSCKGIGPHWNNSTNRPYVSMKCGYWKKPKDIFHKSTHHYRYNQIKLGFGKGLYRNGARFKNRNGYLRKY